MKRNSILKNGLTKLVNVLIMEKKLKDMKLKLNR